MKKYLILLIATTLAMPTFAYAAAAPAKAVKKEALSGPFEGGRVMDARDKSNAKLGVRLGARIMRLKGQITREEMLTVFRATEMQECWDVCCEHLQDMALEDGGLAKGKGLRAGWLDWIIQNWDSILKMIMSIISLFSQALPGDMPMYAADTSTGMLEALPLLLFPQLATTVLMNDQVAAGGCASGKCPVAAAPNQADLAGREVKAQAMQFKRGQPARNGVRAVGRVVTFPFRAIRDREGQPVRNGLRGAGRVILFPFRALHGCGCH